MFRVQGIGNPGRTQGISFPSLHSFWGKGLERISLCISLLVFFFGHVDFQGALQRLQSFLKRAYVGFDMSLGKGGGIWD